MIILALIAPIPRKNTTLCAKMCHPTCEAHLYLQDQSQGTAVFTVCHQEMAVAGLHSASRTFLYDESSRLCWSMFEINCAPLLVALLKISKEHELLMYP